MNDAVAVALKVVAVGMRRFGITAAAGVLDMHGIGGQHEGSVAPGATCYAAAPQAHSSADRRSLAAADLGALHSAQRGGAANSADKSQKDDDREPKPVDAISVPEIELLHAK